MYIDPNRFRSLVAAPMAGLILILCLCAFVVERRDSAGTPLPVTKVKTSSFNDCYYEREIFIRIKNDGSLWINATLMHLDRLAPVIAEIMQNRDQRVVYVLTDPDVSYGRFADVYSKVESSSPGLHVGVITRQIYKELQNCPAGSICGLDWPGHENAHSCAILSSRPEPMINSLLR